MLLCFAELRKDFVKRAPLPVGEVAAPIKSYAPPPSNMQQANAAKGEGKVRFTASFKCRSAVLIFWILNLLSVAHTAAKSRATNCTPQI